jgi:hypothetical protein
VDENGEVEGIAEGVTYIAVVNGNAAELVAVRVESSKAKNLIAVTVKNKKIKAKALKKKALSFKAFTIKNAVGRVSITLIKKGSSAKLFKKAKINAKGVIKLKKSKLKKGTYKIKAKITADGNFEYKPKTVFKTVKIKIK